MEKIVHKPKLSRLYQTVLNHMTILEGVRIGEEEFLEDLRIMNLLKDSSRVHNYDDVQVQAFIVGIPSDNNPEEIANQSYMCYAAHFIDDYFDRPDLDPYPEKLAMYRHDIKGLLDSMGNVGKIGHIMAQRVKHPEGVYKALKRMAYGGLIQLARNPEDQAIFLAEYKKVGLEGVSDAIKEEVLKIRDIPYWTTNKFLGEFFFAAEPALDYTLAELWNLAIGPAGYLHDNCEEEQTGELNFFGEENPTIDELVEMIHIASKNIRDYENGRASQRLEQVRFLRKAFEPVFPVKIFEAYQRLEEQLCAMQ